MPNVQERRIAYQRLYESPLLSVLDYRCHAHKCGAGDEELSENNSIVLLRHGTFAKHFAKRNVFADVNQVVFFSKKSVYRISHPTDHGDRGTYFLVAPQVLNDIVREFDPTIDEHPDQPFPFVTGPCYTRLFWQHADLIRRLERAKEERPEHLWADVTLLRWVAEVLGSAFEKHGQPTKSRRTSTKIDHTEKAEAARAFLASHLSEQVTLNEIAREVAVSPFNFARIFQQQTGLSVHRYLTLLRLRVSLERLSDGDLTKLALDLGFSSHSHFTDVFRREFGKTPSEARKNTTASKLKEISKNLIV
ncbi:AraC family transcriptional regulator [bacterium]|nr:AraC family transcriptional regulator [bacterium]